MILLGDLKPGEFIKYDYLVGYSDICTGQGTITEITEKAIRVRKKSGHYDVLRIRDIERNETRILGREPKKEENEMCKRGAPDCKKLRKAYQESGYNISAVQREFKTHWNTARRWLFEAGLIDKENNPIESGESKQMFSEKKGVIMEQEKKRIYDECAICGDTIKAHERFWCDGRVVCGECKTAHNLNSEINAEPPSASSGGLNAVGVGETISEPQTPVSEPAGSQYEPEDNDYQDEIDKAVAQAAEKNFKRQRFLLEVIANIVELAEVRRTPDEITVEIIKAVLVVA